MKEIYIATDDGLTILDKNNKSVKNALVSMLDKIRVRNLYIDSKNNIWLSTYGHYGVIKYKSDGTYTNLKGGKYQFHFSRKNNDEPISTINKKLLTIVINLQQFFIG